MKCYIQTTEEGRIVGVMPFDTPYPTDGYREFILPDGLEHEYNDYLVVNNEIVYNEAPERAAARIEREAMAARDSFITGAPEQVSNLEDGLMDVANLSSTNETDIEDLTNAIMELAAMIGGNENG